VSVYFSRNGKTLHQGHVLDVLAELPAESVQLAVTSPPYYSLRNYGTAPQVWGGSKDCIHTWGDGPTVREITGGKTPKQTTNVGSYTGPRSAQTCQRCGAWKGELGSEAAPDAFVSHLVEVFAAVRRVLRRDGCLIVNLNDSYVGSGKGPSNSLQRPASCLNDKQLRAGAAPTTWTPIPEGLRPKSRLAVPERFVLAMLADGWIYRDDRAWCKKAPMPESTRDRCTQAWEHVYMFTREGAYFWDQAAVLEAVSEETIKKGGYDENGQSNWPDNRTVTPDVLLVNKLTGNMQPGRRVSINPAGRNPRNYVVLGPDPFPEAHFATFPRALPEFWIKAATSERGACARCGAAWKRVVERERLGDTETVGRPKAVGHGGYGSPKSTLSLSGNGSKEWAERGGKTVPLGWTPSCRCGPDAGTKPQIVCDPFSGSGTTLLVAHLLGREAVGIELNPDYCRIAERRLAADVLPLETA